MELLLVHRIPRKALELAELRERLLDLEIQRKDLHATALDAHADLDSNRRAMEHVISRIVAVIDGLLAEWRP